jgi:hypothetical protein
MSEKKRFRLGDAVVNLCSMAAPLAEEVVSVASKALVYEYCGDASALTSRLGHFVCRDEMTEQEVAAAIKRKLAAGHPAEMWQACGPLICPNILFQCDIVSVNLLQVFVGRNFGSFVTCEDGKYINFYIGQTGFCIYAA